MNDKDRQKTKAENWNEMIRVFEAARLFSIEANQVTPEHLANAKLLKRVETMSAAARELPDWTIAPK